MPEPSVLCHRFAKAALGATFVLLVAGGLVTSQDVGMAVPDWPTTFGENMFTYNFFSHPLSDTGVRFEHSHRLIGSAVGLVTVALALALWRREPRGWVKGLGAAAVAAVVIQGLLGGLRVIENERLLAMVHGSFAHAFFGLTALIAAVTSPSWTTSGPSEDGTRALRPLALALPVAAYLQVLLGALLRHTGVGLELHLIGALVVPVLVFALDDRARAVLGDGTDPLLTTTRRLKVLVIAQLLLGLSAYVGKLAAPVAATAPWPVVLLTMAHQVLGATLLAGSVVAAAFATRRLAEAVTLRPPMADHSSSAPLPGSAT